MKTTALSILLVTACSFVAFAATPEQEKDFVARYKKALEGSDTKALAGFLYTKGATPETVEFFTMMQTISAGQKVSSIELVTPTAEEAAKFNTPMEMPDGKKYKMPFAPIKQLVVVIEEEGGSGKSTSKSPVGEKDGKLVIPVPVPAS